MRDTRRPAVTQRQFRSWTNFESVCLLPRQEGWWLLLVRGEPPVTLAAAFDLDQKAGFDIAPVAEACVRQIHRTYEECLTSVGLVEESIDLRVHIAVATLGPEDHILGQ